MLQPPTDTDTDALRTFGTLQPVAPVIRLCAGDLSCEFDVGAVRHVRWRGIEIVRGISYLLRDIHWGTTPSRMHQLHIEQSERRFSASFALHWKTPAGVLLATARLEGTAAGELCFMVEAQAQAALATNRCGFVLLHPGSAAEAPLHIEHADGSVEDTRFPALISPGQVAFRIRRLRHQPRPGLSVDCLLQAELPYDPVGAFEMEDQRNWSDASFKTYVASLLDPWPYTLPAGRSLRQSVQLNVRDAAARPHGNTDAAAGQLAQPGQAAPTPQRGTARLTIGTATGHRLPEIGLGVPLGMVAMTAVEAAAVETLMPGWLVAEVDAGDAVAMSGQLKHLCAIAARCGARVQLDIICPEQASPAAVAGSVSAACAATRLAVQAVRACPAPYLKSYQPTDQWPELPPLESYARALSAAFPEARIGGGMLTYFTELNRKRQGADALHFIGHSTCPLVHAADDVSVMQTLETLPSIHSSVRAHWPALGYRLGPITLAMHRNPYGERTVANPARERMAMAEEDPRHQAAFGAAWLVGYAAAVRTFGLELLSFHHSHGPSGPLLHRHIPSWQTGACVPAWQVHSVLCRAAGCAVRSLNGLPAGVAGLAWDDQEHATTHVLLANLTPDPIGMHLRGSWHIADLSVPCSPAALVRALAVSGTAPTEPATHAATSPVTNPPAESGAAFSLDRYQTLWLQTRPRPSGW